MTKNGGKVLVWGAMIAAAGLLLAGCSGDKAEEPPAQVQVRYEVLTTTNHNLNRMKGWTPRATVTMGTPDGTSQLNTTLPLMNQDGSEGAAAPFDKGAALYLSAQKDQYSGDLVCRISVDGTVVSENSTTASHGIATCKATA